MRPSRSVFWLKQILVIENKGYRAFLNGLPVEVNPYKGNHSNLQRQRYLAWERGWKLAQTEEQQD